MDHRRSGLVDHSDTVTQGKADADLALAAAAACVFSVLHGVAGVAQRASHTGLLLMPEATVRADALCSRVARVNQTNNLRNGPPCCFALGIAARQ